MFLIFWSPLYPVAKITIFVSRGLASPSMITPSLQKLKLCDFFIRMDPSFSLSKKLSGNTPSRHVERSWRKLWLGTNPYFFNGSFHFRIVSTSLEIPHLWKLIIELYMNTLFFTSKLQVSIWKIYVIIWYFWDKFYL